ncbi:MAG TPA: Na+/H+ antiporter NhaA [Candidatus Limnocylindria bacterium]|nr:Na+/H+ antiporter NhaA [Candidatus Limnocylindria bacterium]
MTVTGGRSTRYHGETAAAAPRLAALRTFLATEAGGAVVLLAATIIALVWANSPWRDTYHGIWATEVGLAVGDWQLRNDLGHWVNDGLMVVFFLLIGLEVRREFDMGEFRERRRVAVPVFAALGGMLLPVGIFLALSPDGDAARGWAMVMATDTAFAVGVLALVGRRSSFRLRTFLLTLVIVDDVAAVLIIALFYSTNVELVAIVVAGGLLVAMALLRRSGIDRTWAYLLLSVAIWIATLQSGIHPTVAGVAIGLLTGAYPPRRASLEEATGVTRRFRQRPSPALASEAARRITLSLSPNERLQHALHPISSFVVVPIFALANAGVDLGGDLVGRVLGSPLVLAIVLGLVLGKTLGIPLGSWLATRAWLGGQALAVGWPSLVAASSVAGIGFTMSLLIAELSYTGETLEEAKLGILLASSVAAILSVGMFHAVSLLPRELLGRAEARTSRPVTDLTDPVDPVRDHVRGPADAPVTLVEYGDFECPYCGRAAPVMRELLSRFEGRLRFVFRHLPLTDVHPNAALAAQAAEAAGAQGRFWEMHDLLFEHQDALDPAALRRHAAQLGLNLETFDADLREGRHAGRVAQDVNSAEEAGVAGTPSLFINEVRYRGAYDLETMDTLVRRVLRLVEGRAGAATRDAESAARG